MTDQQDTLQMASYIHGELKRLIAPATPSSIRMTELTNSGYLIFIMVVAGLSLIFLILSAISSYPVMSVPDTSKYIGILGSAGLGASYYALYTASTYAQKGTFEPKYNQTYLIRLGLGICAGVILALFAPDLLNIDMTQIDTANPASQQNAKTLYVGQNTLALIGGYSAEAVNQILKRFADTLVTAVRGNEKEHVESKAEKDLMKKKMDIGNALQDALSKPDADKAKAIQDIIKNLSERS